MALKFFCVTIFGHSAADAGSDSERANASETMMAANIVSMGDSRFSVRFYANQLSCQLAKYTTIVLDYEIDLECTI